MTCFPLHLPVFSPLLMILISNISPYRNTSASLLTSDLTNVEKWGSDNLVKFNEEKTKQVVITRKHHQDFPPVFMNGHKLDISSSITQLGLSISSNLTWKPHITSISKHASQKLGFLSRAHGYFSPSQLLTIYKSHIRPSLEYCSHVWGGAPNPLSIFLTESSLKLSVSSTIQTSLILYSLSPIVVLLQIFPFSTAIFTDIALRKSRILFLIQ